MSSVKRPVPAGFLKAKEFHKSYLANIENMGFFPVIKESDRKKRSILSAEIDKLDMPKIEDSFQSDSGSDENGPNSPFGVYQYHYYFTQWGMFSNYRPA